MHGLKRFFFGIKASRQNVMKNAYSFYFHIRQITELETFEIWIGKEIFVSRLKNQLLHPWSETVAAKQADKKVMKNIRQITELETFKIWIGKEKSKVVSRLKYQLLHTRFETLLLSIKASRQKSYEECILILLPYSPDYGTWDLQNLKKDRDSRKSLWKSKKLWRMRTHFTSILAR